MRTIPWRCLLIFLAAVVLLDRSLYLLLAAGFQRIEVGETGGMVNRALHVEADMVVLGSSRAWRHYDTALLGNAFHTTAYNAGCDGQGLPYIRGVVDLLLHSSHPPRFLLIDVDPEQLCNLFAERERATVLAPFIDQSSVVRQIIYERGPLEPIKYLSWSFRYNSKILPILRRLGDRDKTNCGYNPVYGTMDPTALARPALPKTVGQLKQPDLAAVGMLRDTIRESKAVGVRVFLVTSPRYRGETAEDLTTVELRSRLERLAIEEQVSYIRITEGTDDVFRQSDLFADRSHLNWRGASVFTEWLIEKLRASKIDEPRRDLTAFNHFNLFAVSLREALRVLAIPVDLPVPHSYSPR
jgi:hypothetical protein